MKRDHDTALFALDDYVRGRGEDVADYELELFERALAEDAPELRLHNALHRTFRSLDARGALELWLTAKDVERVRKSSRVFYAELAEALVTTSIPDDVELMIVRIPLDLTGVRQLDAHVVTPDGRTLKRMPDIAFDPADGAIFACCEADLARLIFTGTAPSTTKVYATYDDGQRLIAQM
jgi:hypothetical protein